MKRGKIYFIIITLFVIIGGFISLANSIPIDVSEIYGDTCGCHDDGSRKYGMKAGLCPVIPMCEPKGEVYGRGLCNCEGCDELVCKKCGINIFGKQLFCTSKKCPDSCNFIDSTNGFGECSCRSGKCPQFVNCNHICSGIPDSDCNPCENENCKISGYCDCNEIPLLKEEVNCVNSLSSLIELYDELRDRLEEIWFRSNKEMNYIESIKKEAGWFECLTEIVTCDNPYELQFKNAKQRRSIAEITLRDNKLDILDKQIYNPETEEFSLTEDDINKLVEAINRMRGIIALLNKIDINENKAFQQHQEAITLTRDIAIDTTLVIGTLGSSALANLGRKGTVVTTRTLATAMKQGAVVLLVFGGGTSLVQNIEDVESGTKTIEQASLDVAIDTAVSGAVGVCAGGATHGVGRAIARKANSIMRKYNFVGRLNRAEKVLKESNLLPEKELTKSQKEQILKAHVSEGGVEEKAKILKDFTKEQKRVLMENWVVGKILLKKY